MEASRSRRCFFLVVLLVVVSSLFVLGNVQVAEAKHDVYPELQNLQAVAIDERQRTGYHFQPPRNWINDPNGPMYYKGLYHLFYQYNPKGAVWGNIVWAHSVSRDLINWLPLEPAIYPSKPFDINGCWSGSATILPNGLPAILYTGIDPDNRQVQNVAYPKNPHDPYLREWFKPDYNPVIPPTEGINASAFRDPTTAWRGEDGIWRTVVGSKRGKRGEAVLYRSRDFMNWKKAKHPLHSVAGTGMWECPDFYPVVQKNGELGVEEKFGVDAGKNTHVFKVSLDLTRYEYYTVGKYDAGKDKYVPESGSIDDNTGLRYDYGNFYASKTFYDPIKGRRILWGWANESDAVTEDVSKGWAGIQLLPRAVWLDDNGKQLVQWPIEEVDMLRGEEVRLEGKTALNAGGSAVVLKGFHGSQADVEAEFRIKGVDGIGSLAESLDSKWLKDPEALCGAKAAEVPGSIGPFGLQVLATHDRKERTSVFFRVFKDQDDAGKLRVLMCSDPTSSTYKSGVYKPTFGGFVDVDIAKDGKISIRTLIDNSVVESFAAGGKTVITSRVYPTLAEGGKARVFAFNNGAADVELLGFRAWHMRSPLLMNNL